MYEDSDCIVGSKNVVLADSKRQSHVAGLREPVRFRSHGYNPSVFDNKDKDLKSQGKAG